MKAALAALALLAAPAALGGAATVEAVQECMRRNIPQTLQIKEIEVTATDRTGGKRMLKGRLYGTREGDRVRAMMKVVEPADLAGAAYLLREGRPDAAKDDIYVFVPALNKVRRITGAAIDGSLWGTDLSYSDIKQVQNAFSGASAQLEATTEIEKRPVHVLAFAPTADQDTRFTTIRAWVDARTCVPLKVEFVEGDAASKRLVVGAADLKQAGKVWYAAQAVMTDVRARTHTRLKVVGVTSDGKLADRYFNPSTFYIGN